MDPSLRIAARGEAVDAGPGDSIVVGRITAVHGVKGWVKIHSFTEPESNIFDYQPWWVEMPSGFRRLEVDEHRSATKGFIAHVVGIDDRDEASSYCQRDIVVPAAVLPQAQDDEVYWYQLEGLRVIARYNGVDTDIGVVTGLFGTGANDVLVVAGDDRSCDRRERLLPYVDDCIGDIDLETGVLVVHWDPDFV